MKKVILAAGLLIALLFVFASCATGEADLWADAIYTEDTVIGEGATVIEVEVIADEKSVTLTVSTDEQYLADALLEYGIVEGEDGAYGLYIKKVNGILADYDVDASYWSLTVNGEYSMTGASEVEIEDGMHYELTRAK